MSYYAALGDIEFERVTAVSQSGERDITVVDAVGAGKISLPQNRGLKRWEIKFESEDAELFDELDAILKRKKPSRLVINGEGCKISERVLLKGYSKQESGYAGIYEGSVEASEYVSSGVKTADLPYIKREGAAPMPQKVVVTEDNEGDWDADLAKLAAQNQADSEMFNYAYIPKKNPAAVKKGEVLNVIISDPNSAFMTEQQKEEAWADMAVAAMDEGLSHFGSE